MKAIIRKTTAILLCIVFVCTGFIALAAESAVLEVRPSTERHQSVATGVYQYGQFMSDEEAQACLKALEDTEIVEHIYDGMLRREEEIYLDEFDEPVYPDDLQTYFTAILNNYPDMYYVSLMYSYYIYDDGTLASLVPIYTMEESDIVESQQLIDNEVAKVCSVVNEGMSDFDKITAVHDYFVDHYSYDYEHLRDNEYMRKHNIVALFVDKAAVCQGYGLGFQYVMNKLGIECRTVQSIAMNHLWNLVQLENGNWYHVDVTWDDPSQDWYDPYNTPNMTDEEYAMAIGDVRTFFMLSDNEIKSESVPHHSYTPDGLALDDAYGKTGLFEVNTAITWADGKWYYIDNTGKLHCYNAANDTDTVLLDINGGWPYVASFADVYSHNGKIYYNTAKNIMAYDVATGESSEFLSSPDGVGDSTCIYSMSIDKNGTLSYMVATDYLGTNSSIKTYDLGPVQQATPKPTQEVTEPVLVEASTDGTDTVVNITGTVSGVVCAADYEGDTLVSAKILGAASTVTFEGIAADKIFVWESAASMKPLCDAYIIE